MKLKKLISVMVLLGISILFVLENIVFSINHTNRTGSSYSDCIRKNYISISKELSSNYGKQRKRILNPSPLYYRIIEIKTTDCLTFKVEILPEQMPSKEQLKNLGMFIRNKDDIGEVYVDVYLTGMFLTQSPYATVYSNGYRTSLDYECTEEFNFYSNKYRLTKALDKVLITKVYSELKKGTKDNPDDISVKEMLADKLAKEYGISIEMIFCIETLWEIS